MKMKTKIKASMNWRRWKTEHMDIIKFKDESEKVCYYCGKKITKKEDLTADHIIPVSKGGKTSKDNLVIACKACNLEKANLDVGKYLDFLNIMKAAEQINTYTHDAIGKIINGLKDIIQTFNTELNNVKKKIALLEKKRSAVLQSMMYKKFNVVQGYDYAKTLRDLTEEIFSLKLALAQMTEVYAKTNMISPFLTSSTPGSIRKKAVKELRDRTLNEYYSLGNIMSEEADKPEANLSNLSKEAPREQDMQNQNLQDIKDMQEDQKVAE